MPLASAEDVDRAVAAAKAAFPAWADTPVTVRGEYLIRLAHTIDENTDYLALMDAVDSGNAVSGMRADMKWTADTLRYFAGLITEMKGETMSRERGHLKPCANPMGSLPRSTLSTTPSASVQRRRHRRWPRAIPSSSKDRNRRHSPA